MKHQDLFEQLIAHQNLNSSQMKTVIRQCMNGDFNDLQIAAFLALMRMKGETSDELMAAAEVMQELATPIHFEPAQDLIDIVGTGGDHKNTFNVSTACSFVVAAAGIPVAKHGNRSVSGRSGSADLLEQAGFRLQLSEPALHACMNELGLVFLFAPHYHPAMKYARAARQQLSIRTLFNLLGPLINPARVKKQVIGVFSIQWLEPIAKVLAHLGSTHSLVVSSLDGMDEISIVAPTQVVEYKAGSYSSWRINPEDYGIKHQSLDAIIVDSPKHSLTLIQQVFSGILGPARDMIILNAAAAIYCAKNNLTYSEAITIAQTVIDNGKAAQLFEKLCLLTQHLSTESPDE